MKRKIVFFLFLLTLTFLGGRQINRYFALKNSDVIVRIAYRGLDNLFRTPLKYYAINSTGACKIPKDMVIQRFGEEVKTRELNDDEEEATYWLVTLSYRKYDENFARFSRKSIGTAMGEQYRMDYSPWNNKPMASEEEISTMLQVAETLYYDYPPQVVVDSEKNSFSILNFILIHHGTTYLIADNTGSTLRRIGEDGSLVKVMDLPKGGQFDYYYFYGE